MCASMQRSTGEEGGREGGGVGGRGGWVRGGDATRTFTRAAFIQKHKQEEKKPLTAGDRNSTTGERSDKPLAELSQRLRMWTLTDCTMDTC